MCLSAKVHLSVRFISMALCIVSYTSSEVYLSLFDVLNIKE